MPEDKEKYEDKPNDDIMYDGDCKEIPCDEPCPDEAW
jgi:hypothetical protein